MTNKYRPVYALEEGIPEDTDIFYVIKDPSGTPLDRKITLSALADFIGAGGGEITIGANQVAYATAENTLGGSNDFLLDPTGMSQAIATISHTGSGPAYGGTVTLINPDGATAFGVFLNESSTDSPGGNGFRASSVFNPSSGDAGSGGAVYTVATKIGDGSMSDLIGIQIHNTVGGMGALTNNYGLLIDNVTTATNNYAIKTGSGDIVFGALAGTGTRTVVVDANGKLSAP